MITRKKSIFDIMNLKRLSVANYNTENQKSSAVF